MNEVYTLITGGSQGIGKALAEECATRKMNLLLIALPGPELQETAKEIASHYNVKVETLAVDLATLDGPQTVFRWAEENEYRVNILINNAGIAGTSVFNTSDIYYNDVRILVNIRALVLLTRLFLPVLNRHPEAYILNIGSLSAYFSIPYKAVYSASKAFVLSFSRALNIELANTSISVTVVCPNGVETNKGTYGRIAAHGLMGRLTKIDAQRLAKIALDGMFRKEEVIIPKSINRILMAMSRLVPYSLKRHLLKRSFYREVQVTHIT